jgi:tetratricopeptide (TPR) repeat protein
MARVQETSTIQDRAIFVLKLYNIFCCKMLTRIQRCVSHTVRSNLIYRPTNFGKIYSFRFAHSSPLAFTQDVDRLGRAITLLVLSGHGDQGITLVDQIKSRHHVLDDIHSEECLRGKAAGALFALQIACMRAEENKQPDAGKIKLKPHSLQFDVVLKRCKDVDFLTSCATTLKDVGMIEYSSRMFSVLVEKDPKNYTYRYNLARIHEQLGHYSIALKHYNIIFENNPEAQSTISARISHCLEQTGEFEEAAKFYQIHAVTELEAVNSAVSSGNVVQNIRKLFNLKEGKLSDLEGAKLDKIVENMLQLAYLYTMDERFDKADIVYESLALLLTGFISSFGEDLNSRDLQLVTNKFVSNSVSVVYNWITCLRKQTKLDKDKQIEPKRIQSIDGMLGLALSLIPQIQGVDYQTNLLAILSQLHLTRIKAPITVKEEWGYLSRAYPFAQSDEQAKLVIWEAINVLLNAGDQASSYIPQLLKWISQHERVHANNAMLWQQVRRLQNQRVSDPSATENKVIMVDVTVGFFGEKGQRKCRKYRVIEASVDKAQKTVIDFEMQANTDVAVIAIENHSWKEALELISDMRREQEKLLGYTANERFIFTGIVQSSISAPLSN